MNTGNLYFHHRNDGGLDLPGGHRDVGEASAACALIRECVVEELRLPSTLEARLREHAAHPPRTVVLQRRGGTHVVSVWVIPATARELTQIEQTKEGRAEAHTPEVRSLKEFIAGSPYAVAIQKGLADLRAESRQHQDGSSWWNPAVRSESTAGVPAVHVGASPGQTPSSIQPRTAQPEGIGGAAEMRGTQGQKEEAEAEASFSQATAVLLFTLCVSSVAEFQTDRQQSCVEARRTNELHLGLAKAGYALRGHRLISRSEGPVLYGALHPFVEPVPSREQAGSPSPALLKYAAYRLAPGTRKRPENLSVHGEATLGRLPSLLVDSGAALNALDDESAAEMEVSGDTKVIRWQEERIIPGGLQGVAGSSVVQVGTCVIEIALYDPGAAVWRCFDVEFQIIRGGRTRILGMPFLKANRGVLDLHADSLTCMHAGESFITPIATGEEAYDQVLAQLEAGATAASAAQPLAYTTENFELSPWGWTSVQIATPAHYAGQEIMVMRNDAPEHAQSFANLKGLRIREGIYIPDAEGRVCLDILNPSKDRTVVPAHVPVAVYSIRPDISPKIDLSVDELVDSLHIEGVDEEELALHKSIVKEIIFDERQKRAAYFSEKRMGRGLGPPLKLQEVASMLNGGKPPPNTPARPINAEQMAVVLDYWKAMVKGGQLEPSTAEYGAPIVCVRKPKAKPGAAKWRIACDYRLTNECILHQHHPLPRIQECLDALGKSEFFSTADMINAFWQLPLADERSKDITTINFPGGIGRYRFSTTPMGLQPASAAFQRAMDVLLQGMSPHLALSYIDDLICHTAGEFPMHVLAFARVLDRVGGAGYIFRPSKTVIGRRSCEFLGMICSKEGNKPDPARTGEYSLMPFPEVHEKLQHWVNFVTYYLKHIPQGASWLLPLRERLADKVTRPPLVPELEAFQHLQRELARDGGPVLMRPDFTKHFFLIVDAASTVGGGVCVAQVDDAGRERPISFWSRVWGKVSGEKRWHPIQHELTIVHDAVLRYDKYLAHARFTVISDCEPLQFLWKSVRQPKGKFADFIATLQSYSFQVIHRPGYLMGAADALSRLADLIREGVVGAQGALHSGVTELVSQENNAAEQEGAVALGGTVASILARQDAAAPERQGKNHFDRRRVTVVIFNVRYVLVCQVLSSRLALPAAFKRGRMDPVRITAIPGQLQDNAEWAVVQSSGRY